MSEHKFVVGQRVLFLPDWFIDPMTEGQYTVVQLFPNEGHLPQYRIKSEQDGHERMVLEDRLDGRPWQGLLPPAVAYVYSENRQGVHPRATSPSSPGCCRSTAIPGSVG